MSNGQNIRRTAHRAIAAAAAFAVVVAAPAAAAPSPPTSEDLVDVIVREVQPETNHAESLVERIGGTVGDELGIIGGFSATVPTAALGRLSSDRSVLAVTHDTTVESTTAGWGDAASLSDSLVASTTPGWDDATSLSDLSPKAWKGSMVNTGRAIGVDTYWARSFTGQGVGVALIDTGVVPVEGLTVKGKVVDGADLSFESQSKEYRYLDTYGHGTHLAGIIAGRDAAAPRELRASDSASHFLGIAPDARIVSVKVGDRHGAVDVSQVIAAIDWVTQHKDDKGLNIRVLNLSFGTDSTQNPALDPLSYAVEQAWQRGLFVVVASGNDGNAKPVRNPATNPYVLTVGAADPFLAKTSDAAPIPPWSNCGTSRTVDVVAPGASIVSLRNPGSLADVEHPEARVDKRFFLGSGTSQAAAVVSGAAALMLERNPDYSPDDLKSVLMQSATPYENAKTACQGEGIINLENTWKTTPQGSQRHVPATGLGSLEAARGTDHLENNGVVLAGEQDIMGNKWDAKTWAAASAAGKSWDGGIWNRAAWTGASWSGASWSGASWSTTEWQGASWSGASWSGSSWLGPSWSGASWSGASWSGASWSGASWSGASWSGRWH